MERTKKKSIIILTAVWMGALSVTGCSAKTSGEVVLPTAAESLSSQEDLTISLLSADTAKAPAPAFTEVHDTVSIKGNQVRLRSTPSTAEPGNIIAVLDHGAVLQRTGDSDDWCQVIYNGMTLYVAKSFVTVGGTASAPADTSAGNQATAQAADGSAIALDSGWRFAEFSAIHSGTATLYRSSAANRKGITVCVNAGHGTNGGGNAKTFCHPDGSPKVTGGSTASGATKATAVSSGMTFLDGTPERNVTLALAKVLKEKLLGAGYDVVMIRESDDVQLDNIARTVIANNTSDCHIALHWDSSENDKGAFYMSVPNVSSYRAMEPVASNWQKHNNLGENLISGLRGAGVKIFSGGSMEMDLTQTSYSTIPSIDIELGDKGSDHSSGTMEVLANGLLAGVNSFFGQ